jgi:hypothetical protein
MATQVRQDVAQTAPNSSSRTGAFCAARCSATIGLCALQITFWMLRQGFAAAPKSVKGTHSKCPSGPEQHSWLYGQTPLQKSVFTHGIKCEAIPLPGLAYILSVPAR